jgi:hypothetical protein
VQVEQFFMLIQVVVLAEATHLFLAQDLQQSPLLAVVVEPLKLKIRHLLVVLVVVVCIPHLEHQETLVVIHQLKATLVVLELAVAVTGLVVVEAEPPQ